MMHSLSASSVTSFPFTPIDAKQHDTRRRYRTLVSIEGNIGIGKSTLLNNLKKRYACEPAPPARRYWSARGAAPA